MYACAHECVVCVAVLFGGEIEEFLLDFREFESAFVWRAKFGRGSDHFVNLLC